MADNDQNVFNFVSNNSKKIQLTNKEVELVKNMDSSEDTVSFLNDLNKDSIKQQGEAFVQPQPKSIDDSIKPTTFDSFTAENSESVKQIDELTTVPAAQQSPSYNENSMDAIADRLGPIQSRFSSSQNQVPVEKIQEIKERDADKFKIDAFKEMERIENKIDEQLAKTNELPSTATVTTNNVYDDAPVDFDYAEDGTISLFYNFQKAMAFRGLGKIAPMFPVRNSFFESPFFSNRAKKLYEEYLKRKNASEADLKKMKLKRTLKLAIIPTIILLLIAGRIIFKVAPARNASQAHAALASGDYATAENIFCEKVKDGPHCAFTRAMIAQANGDYDKAYEYLDKLTDYQNSLNYNLEDARNEFKYRQAVSLLDKKEYTEGLNILREISNYKDAAEIFYSTCYDLAVAYENSNEEVALRYYYMAKKHEDAEVKFSNLAQLYYDEAMDLYSRKNYKDARSNFSILKQYKFKDSELMYNQCDYATALSLYRDGNYAESNDIFSKMKNFKDSRMLIVDLNNLDQEVEEVRQNDLLQLLKTELNEMQSQACAPFKERIESILAERLDFFTTSYDIIPENENGNVLVKLNTGEEITLSIPDLQEINLESEPRIEASLADYIVNHRESFGLTFDCSNEAEEVQESAEEPTESSEAQENNG